MSVILGPKILELLKTRGQMHMRHLEAALDQSYVDIGNDLRTLMAAKRVVVLGTVREAGWTDAQSNAPVYGLAGTQLVKVRRKKKTRTAGSGQIAGKIEIGRGTRWGASIL